MRVSARRAIVQGDLGRARELLRGAISPENAAAERAASAELLYVIDVWSSSGRPLAQTSPNDAPAPDATDDWDHAFANARESLVVGRYAEAARRFDALVGSAPDLVAGARAAELRALAREATPAVDAAPPRSTLAPPSVAADVAPQTETRWYGWQTLISDGVAIVTTPLLPPLGVSIYALGGPIVHVVHLRGLAVLGSLGIRIVAPVSGVLVGLQAANGCDGFLCELEGAAWGALIGVGVAVAIDAAFIAREEVSVTKEKKVTFVPILTPARVGVGGTF